MRVETSHSSEWCPRNALLMTATPTSRVTRPTQSHLDQPARRRDIHSERQARKSAASTNTAHTTPSSPRTNGAIAAATTAAAIHQRVGARRTRRTRKRQSVEYGYASGSSTIIDEYASAGIAAEARATNSAG